MAIKSIYIKYFQKSKMFLYPLLGFKKGVKVIPSETYIAWDSFYIPDDIKLVCLYHPNKSNEYDEKKVLLKHNRLCDVQSINEHNKLFIFDFFDLKNDWLKFMTGKYSEIDNEIKSKILYFFPENTANYVYMRSYLYPKLFFKDYAATLAVEEDLLKEVGELCEKPDFEKETLIMKQEDLQKNQIIN